MVFATLECLLCCWDRYPRPIIDCIDLPGCGKLRQCLGLFQVYIDEPPMRDMESRGETAECLINTNFIIIHIYLKLRVYIFYNKTLLFFWKIKNCRKKSVGKVIYSYNKVSNTRNKIILLKIIFNIFLNRFYLKNRFFYSDLLQNRFFKENRTSLMQLVLFGIIVWPPVNKHLEFPPPNLKYLIWKIIVWREIWTLEWPWSQFGGFFANLVCVKGTEITR